MNLEIGSTNHYLPPNGNTSGGVSSVRSSVQRQRIFININQQQKRNQHPVSFDPTLSDQRRKANMPFAFQGSLIQQNTSHESRGNSGSSNGRAIQVLTKKQINFGTAHNNNNVVSIGGISSNRSNQHPSLSTSQKRTTHQRIPLQRMVPDSSPRNQAQSTTENKLSSRSNTGAPPQHPQRKNVSAHGSKQHPHQLAYRRHQVMDITDDAHTISMNKLTIEAEQTSSREQLDNHHSQPPPAGYNMFYHGGEGTSYNRFNSKKSLRDLKKQPSKPELNQPPQVNNNSFMNKTQDQAQLFQFTRKSNLMGENSLSSTRDKVNQGSMFKIKKTSVNNLIPNGAPSSEHIQVPQIGKRKPLIIRKNNFINQSASNAQNDISGSTGNQHSTILSGIHNRFNNTNNLNSTGGAGISEASQSQTRYGITQILKSLNSTAQSNELSNSLANTNQALRESKLIKVNQSKKRLDTARKSRIQQIQQQDSNTTHNTTSLLLQNTQSSFVQQPPVISFLAQKKRSFLIPKVKIENSLQPMMAQFHPSTTTNAELQQKASARLESGRNLSQPPGQQQQPSLHQIYGSNGAQPASNVESNIQQPQKYIKRGQILRLAKKQQDLSLTQRGQSQELGNANQDIKQQQNSLTRVESKKELSLTKEESKHKLIKASHQVAEQFVIHENLNDSSCTPADTSFILSAKSKLQSDTVQKQPMSKDLSLKLETLEITVDLNDKKPTIDISSKQQLQHVKQSLPLDKPSASDAINVKGRHLNHSANIIKSPIGTATSFKSQNSQQAGQNVDEVIKFPMKPSKALKLFLNQMSDYEKGEILDYQEIFFLGLQAQKIQGSPKNEFNYGYDDDKGDFKVIVNDHIGYRYEILSFIGKGSFGTALKCFDHKTKEEVAIKIVKNKKKYQYQAGIELKILNFLKENDPDDIMNVVHMKDYVIFRKHLCITFELLSMNLFEFLKINDFNGFDHNLIRRFAIQLLYALKYLKEFQIIHCDLKPENILLKEPNKSGIKIIDFGSSAFIDERVYTYIQSRFYRAPEIMLGIPYTCAIDMWSFGCIMAELYIGYPIFPGESENDQMSRVIEMINIPSREVYTISQRRQKFFNENEKGEYIPIMVNNSRGKLRKAGGKPLSLLIGDEDPDFLDFVQKCLDWNPETRLSPDDALRHVWVLKGLPPQVLIHHQRMHNIATPELPEVVKEARDKFFLESTITMTETPSKYERGSREKQPQEQTHQAKSHLNSAVKHTSQQKNETIKSLERAQLKNQLHQLNHNKQHQSSVHKTGGALVIHSKIAGNDAARHNAREQPLDKQKFITLQSQPEQQPSQGFKRRARQFATKVGAQKLQ